MYKTICYTINILCTSYRTMLERYDKYFASCSYFAIYFMSFQVSRITTKYEKQGKYLSYCKRLACDNQFIIGKKYILLIRERVTLNNTWKSKTRVTSSNTRVMSSNLRVTSSNSQVASSNPRVRRLKARVGRLKVGARRLKARVKAIKP